MFEVGEFVKFGDSCCGSATQPHKLCSRVVFQDSGDLFDPVAGKGWVGTRGLVKLRASIDVVESVF